MSDASTIPGALTALLAIASSTAPTGVQIIDGPPASDLEDSYICIGYSGQPDTMGIEVEQQVAGARTETEIFSVHGNCSALSGDVDFDAARRAAFAIYDSFVAGLAADRRLGRTVTQTQIAVAGIEQSISGDAIVTVHFSVRCEGMRLS